MSNIIIIHGTGGNPDLNWFPWLKSELNNLDCKVFIPTFPTPENQNINSWLKVFLDYRKYLDNESIVIGHSLGVAFLINILESIDFEIKSAFFVAGFTDLLDKSEFDILNHTFVNKSFDWSKIKKNCKNFYVINSDNDPYVELEKGYFIAEKLDTELIVLKKAGHINQDSGYKEFPFLLNLIKNNLL